MYLVYSITGRQSTVFLNGIIVIRDEQSHCLRVQQVYRTTKSITSIGTTGYTIIIFAIRQLQHEVQRQSLIHTFPDTRMYVMVRPWKAGNYLRNR